jgi:uncharacterized protein YggE
MSLVRFAVWFVVLAVICPARAADPVPTEFGGKRVVRVTGVGKVSVPLDVFTLHATISSGVVSFGSAGPNLIAMRKLVLERLASVGVEENAVTIAEPEPDAWGNGKVRLTCTLSAKMPDPDTARRARLALIEFVEENTERDHATLRTLQLRGSASDPNAEANAAERAKEAALLDAKAEAETVARTYGLAVGGPVYVGPIENRASYERVPLRERTVQRAVTVVFELLDR